MRQQSNVASVVSTMVVGIILLAFGSSMSAQAVKTEGFITDANGDQFTVRFGSGAELTFVLTENTDVSEIGRLAGPGKKEMAESMLIPGLKVKVEGAYNESRQVLAESVKFKHDDLEQAQAAQAAVHPVKVENAQQQQELERQNAELRAQNEALQQHEAQLTEQQKQVEANKAAITANTARFGQLDDYYIWDEVTVYFGNGKANVDPQYESSLLAMAEKAKNVDGYVIEVKGYTSSAGSVPLNQRLSEERVNNVTNILLQKGHVPLTRMLGPGAMGESQAVADSSSKSEAEQRRVVVRVLQNKAIAGTHSPGN